MKKEFTIKVAVDLDMEDFDSRVEYIYWGDDFFDDIKLWEKGVKRAIWELLDAECECLPLKPIFEQVFEEIKSQKGYKTKYKKMLKDVLDYFE